tara:strand:+ start:127 stop:306 length:180 start_codon:yes stop_codon:yes gene_type:complete
VSPPVFVEVFASLYGRLTGFAEVINVSFDMQTHFYQLEAMPSVSILDDSLQVSSPEKAS